MPSGWWRKEGIQPLMSRGGFQTGLLGPSSLVPSSPECHLNPASSVLPQLCLSISNLVQGLNVHLGTLIGKTWEPRGNGKGPLRPSGTPRPFSVLG